MGCILFHDSNHTFEGTLMWMEEIPKSFQLDDANQFSLARCSGDSYCFQLDDANHLVFPCEMEW